MNDYGCELWQVRCFFLVSQRGNNVTYPNHNNEVREFTFTL